MEEWEAQGERIRMDPDAPMPLGESISMDMETRSPEIISPGGRGERWTVSSSGESIPWDTADLNAPALMRDLLATAG